MPVPVDPNKPKTPYEVLGIKESELGKDEAANNRNIKKAYYKLAKENHPDKKPGDKEAEDNFKFIAAAYAQIETEQKRKELRNSSPNSGSAPAPGPNATFDPTPLPEGTAWPTDEQQLKNQTKKSKKRADEKENDESASSSPLTVEDNKDKNRDKSNKPDPMQQLVDDLLNEIKEIQKIGYDALANYFKNRPKSKKTKENDAADASEEATEQTTEQTTEKIPPASNAPTVPLAITASADTSTGLTSAPSSTAASDADAVDTLSTPTSNNSSTAVQTPAPAMSPPPNSPILMGMNVVPDGNPPVKDPESPSLVANADSSADLPLPTVTPS